MGPTAPELLGQLKALEPASLPSGAARYVFAAESRLAPPLHALAGEDEDLARAAHGVCRRCKDVVCHVFEFAHDPLEALSFLACHGWPSPLLDLTASAEVALRRAKRAVTVVDLAALPSHLLTCDSSFLAHGGELDGPPRRRLEEREVVLTHAEWRNFDTAADFELSDPRFAEALTLRAFEGPPLASPKSKPAEAAGDAVRSALHAAIRKAGRKVLGPEGVDAIETLLSRMPER